MTDDHDKPVGRDAVKTALIAATTEIILERGVTMSVRDIARRAGVNHGLVHTYFGSKEALLTEAFGAIIARAATEVDPEGFPPADLAVRRDGQLTKALARVMLEVADDDPFPAHPILPGWRAALAATRPDASIAELNAAVMISASLGLGWALFAEFLCGVLDIDADGISAIEQQVLELVAEFGGLPMLDSSDPTAEFSSDEPQARP